MRLNNLPKGVLIFGLIEILIGFVTLSTITYTLILGLNTKPINVLVFVYVTSFFSLILGIGLLKLNKLAHELLLYFAGVIILSKILVIIEIIHLNGALETNVDPNIKNAISILYHLSLWCYLNKKGIKSLFAKNVK